MNEWDRSENENTNATPAEPVQPQEQESVAEHDSAPEAGTVPPVQPPYGQASFYPNYHVQNPNGYSAAGQQPYQNQQGGPNGQYYNQNPQYAYQNQPYGGSVPPRQTNPPKNGKGARGGKRVFIGLLCAAIVIGGVGIAVAVSERNMDNAGNSQTNSASDSMKLNQTPTDTKQLSAGDVLTSSQVYDKVKDSVVGLLVLTNNGSGEGSGVVMGEDSTGKYTYIITCAHVINGAQKVQIQMRDETTYDAAVVGTDSRTDVGVLRVNETGFTAAEFGDANALRVGSPVYALGNPGGAAFYGSFTNGMVSAIDRPVSSSVGYTMTCIQHTAAINPGNSGGALINEYGQVIGINSSKIASTEYEGMGFAVPISTVKNVVDSLIASGYVPGRPMLGITYQSVYSDSTYGMVAQIKGLPKGSVVIASINQDSGLFGTNAQKGDIITKANGKNLDTTSALSELIEGSKVGDELTLTLCRVSRDYQISEFDVTIKLVEDKGTNTVTEEQTSNPSASPFGR